MAFKPEHVPTLMRHMGVPVTLGSVTTSGIIDEHDEVVTDPAGTTAQIRVTELWYQTGTISPVPDQVITIDSLAYQVQGEPSPLDDGAFSKVQVAR